MVAVATAAAVASAAATAASAGMQASGGKGGGGAPEMQGMNAWEKIFNRGTADMLDEERRVMEDAISQANWMQPELYALLGYEPIYDERGATPENLQALGQAVDVLNAKQQEGKMTMADNTMEIKRLQKELRGLKGKKNRAERKDIRDHIQALRKEKKLAKAENGPLQKEAAAAQKALSDAQTMPRRVVGVRKLDKPADPTKSGDLYQMAFDLENQTLLRALKGEEPVDATLKTEWDEREKVLRERLRRQLGSDFETSTAGMQTLANFDREKGEAFAEFNQKTIGRFHELTTNRAASLSDLTGARMQQLLYPSRSQAASSLLIGQAANDRLGIAQLFQNERTAQYGAKKDAAAADAAASQQRAAAIAGLINSTGQGVGAAGNTLGSYLGNQTPSNPYNQSISTPNLH